MPTTTPGRNNLDTTTSGSAVIVKALQGAGISLSATGVDAGTGDVTIGLAVPVAVANGGTGQTTALAARGSSGLNLESTTATGDANYTAVATDIYIVPGATAFTAQRTLTLPAANTVNPGFVLYISDRNGCINGANTWVVAPNGADLINFAASSIVLDSAKSSLTVVSNGISNWSILARSPAVRVRSMSSGTAYTTTPGCKAMYVECIGGGGGGGGAVASASNAAGGGGGAGGSYAATYILNPKASYTYAVGGGGAAGTAAGGNGGIGGDTSFDTVPGPAVCVGKGGNGGVGAATGGASVGAIASGGTGSAGNTGDFQMIGGDGAPAIRWSGTAALSGAGGNAARGGGITNGRFTAAAGISGNNYGGGGSGGLSLSATGVLGGAGAFGVITVTEYF